MAQLEHKIFKIIKSKSAIFWLTILTSWTNKAWSFETPKPPRPTDPTASSSHVRISILNATTAAAPTSLHRSVSNPELVTHSTGPIITAAPTTPSVAVTANPGLLRRIASTSGSLVYTVASTAVSWVYRGPKAPTTVNQTVKPTTPELSISTIADLPSASTLRSESTLSSDTITTCHSPPLLTDSPIIFNSTPHHKLRLNLDLQITACVAQKTVGVLPEQLATKSPDITVRPASTTIARTARAGSAFTAVSIKTSAIHDVIIAAARDNQPTLLAQFLTRLKSLAPDQQNAILQAREPNLKNTPLHTAILMANPAVVTILNNELRSLGIDQTHCRNNYKHTPADLITDKHRTYTTADPVDPQRLDFNHTCYANYIHANEITPDQRTALSHALYPATVSPRSTIRSTEYQSPTDPEFEPPPLADMPNPTTNELIVRYTLAQKHAAGARILNAWRRTHKIIEITRLQRDPNIVREKELIARDRIANTWRANRPKIRAYNQNFNDNLKDFNYTKSLEYRLTQHKLAQIPKLLDRLT